MSTYTPLTTVASGLYYGFSAAEIAVEKERYKEAVKAFAEFRQIGGGGEVTLISQNGRQTQYTQAAAQSMLAAWRQELVNAEAQLAGEPARHADRAVSRFA